LAALRDAASASSRRPRRALATKPDRDQAQELVDLLPQLDVDVALLAEESFREMLAALDFRATFEPAVRMRGSDGVSGRRGGRPRASSIGLLQPRIVPMTLLGPTKDGERCDLVAWLRFTP